MKRKKREVGKKQIVSLCIKIFYNFYTNFLYFKNYYYIIQL